MDKIISYLEANKIPYYKEGDFFSLEIKDKDKKVFLYYYPKKKQFYIKSNKFTFQPHVITHWNPTEKHNNMYALCLTMDGSDYRDHILSAKDSINRARTIVFELWDNPISERFNEFSIIHGIKELKTHFISNDGVVIKIKNNEGVISRSIEDVKYVNLRFDSQTSKFFSDFARDNNGGHKYILFKIKFNGEYKKIFVKSTLPLEFYKLNDVTNESFFGRTGEFKNIEKAIIIGAGSIGGMVLDQLCRAGFKEIEIYDKENFDMVNNPRHVIGANLEHLSTKKVVLLKSHYESLFPMVNVIAHGENFWYNREFDNGEIIFNTTGGSHNKTFNKFLLLSKQNSTMSAKFVNIFIEPFGAAIHGVVFNVLKDIENIDYDYDNSNRYLVTAKKDFRKSFDGCFTPTLPYGFASIQIGIPLLMSTLYKNDFSSGHYTIPLAQVIGRKKYNEIANEKISKKINPLHIGVIKWRKND